MHYPFPKIKHIDDVLPAIEGKEEFIVSEKDDYKVINYVVAKEDTFPDIKTAGGSAKMREERMLHKTILRECRGLIFDKEGKLIARRLHKFFNVNERNETQLNQIDLSKPHKILEKLDGSMITPIPIGGGYRLGTKMGITDVAMSAEEFIADKPNYIDFFNDCADAGLTPIFEFCSNKHKIVVDHPNERLVLIAVRNIETGDYIMYLDMKHLGTLYNIEVVQQYPGTVETMQNLVQSIRDQEEGEGWIIRFDDGHMVKIKSDQYVLKHKSKDLLLFEKNVLDLIINDKLDDVVPLLTEEDLRKVKDHSDQVHGCVVNSVFIHETYFDSLVRHMNVDRIRYAKEFMNKKEYGTISSVIFDLYSGKDCYESIIGFIRKNISTQQKIDSIRDIFNLPKWKI